jgi:hypothetical protein
MFDWQQGMAEKYVTEEISQDSRERLGIHAGIPPDILDIHAAIPD